MRILESLRGPDVAGLETRHDVEGLLTALSHKKTPVRLKAAKALGRLRDTKTVEALIVALEDADWEVGEAAAEALGELADKKAVGPLIALLGHKKTPVRLKAAKALGRLRDTKTVEALIVALEDADWEVREAATEALGELADKRAVGPLIALVNSTDVTSATKILEEEAAGKSFSDWEPVKARRARIQRTQESAARALGKVGEQAAVGPLVQALERRLWLRRSVRRLTAGNSLKPEEVIHALEDEPEAIRFVISMTVSGYLRGGSTAAKLQYLFTDSAGFSKLQPEAVAALVKALDTLPFFTGSGLNTRSGGRDALARVIGEIKMRPDEEGLVEKAIVRALGRLGGGQARKVLSEIRDKPSSFLREVAGEALEQMAELAAKPDEPPPAVTWNCARCQKTLTPLDWSRGAVTLGELPKLYDGVVCSACGKLECVACKGSSPDAPCSWCSGPVSPAYEHLLTRPTV